ncbi:hypothetical protein LDENG_00272580 [Lucifuga dentata]|nr:hypothetical protein LDENG_00272580 [Lucifuga dentata]
MGKAFAPSYANIYMAHWEQSALATAPLKPHTYLRFLDDIWGIWTYSRQDFNKQHTSIKTKYTLHNTHVNFLDTITYKGPNFHITNRLDSKVYFKDTDTHALLFKTSFHPQHTFKGLIKSQLLRFYKICTRQQDFWEAKQTLFQALKSRGYTRAFLKKILNAFMNFNINKLDSGKLIPFITTFSKTGVQLNTHIKNNFNKFLKDTIHLQNYRVISAYRRNQNLGDLLVHSKLSSLNPKITSSVPEYQPLTWIKSKSTQKFFKIRPIHDPNINNCVYLIRCTRCGKQYVGQTKNTIRERLYQHKYNINNDNNTETYIVQHFKEHGLQYLRITGLQANMFWSVEERRSKERSWIRKLNTIHPLGLNEA